MPRKQRSSIKLKRRPFSEGDGVSISPLTQSTEAGAVKDDTSTNVEVGAVKDEILNKVVVGAVKDEASANVEVEAVKDKTTTSVKVKEVKYDTTKRNVGVTINTDNEKTSHEYTKQNSTRIHLSHGVRTKFTINVGPIDNDLKYTVKQNVPQLSPQLASNFGEAKQNFSDSAKTFTSKEPVLEEVFIEDIRQNEESLPVNVEEMLFLSEDILGEPQTNKTVETQYKKVSPKEQNVEHKHIASPCNDNLHVVINSRENKSLHVFEEEISPLIRENNLESMSFDTFEIIADEDKEPYITVHKNKTPQINFSISGLGLNVSGKKKKDTGEDSDSDDDSEKGKKKKDKSGFGFGMKMPKFGGSGKADIHGPEVDVDGKLKGGISADVDVPHLKSKVEGPDVDVSAKLPSGNVDINAPHGKGSIPGIDVKGGLGLNVSGKKKKDTGEDSDSDDDSEKGKKKKDKSGFGFGMKMPKFGGSVKGHKHCPEVDVDGKLKGGISADVGVPHLKSKVEGPDVDVSAKLPSGNVDTNSSHDNGSFSGFDDKGVNISSNISNISSDSSPAVIEIDKVVKKRKDKDKSSFGFKLKMPKFGGSSKADSCVSDIVAGGTIKSDVSVDPLSSRSKSDIPEAHLSGGKLNVTLSDVSEYSDKLSKKDKKRHLFGNNKKLKNNSNFFCSLDKPSVESPKLDSHIEFNQPSGEIAPSDSFVAIDIGENSLIDNQDLSVNASPRSASFLQKYFQKNEPKPKSQSLSDDRNQENKKLSSVDKKAFMQEVSIGDVKQDFVIIESSSSPKSNDHIKSPKSPSLLRRIGMFFHLHSDNYNLEKVDSESHSKEDKASDLKDSHSVKGDDCFEIPDVVITVSKNSSSTLSVTHSSANSSGLPTVVEGNVSSAISGENIVSDGDSTQKTKSTITSDFSISGESSVKFSIN